MSKESLNHRSRAPEVALWTARAIALYRMAEEIVLAAPGLPADGRGAEVFRRRLAEIGRGIGGDARRRRVGVFNAVSAVFVSGDTLKARIATREHIANDWWLESFTSPLRLEVVSREDVYSVPAIDVACRILVAPLSALELAPDFALKTTEAHLALNGNAWVAGHGKPWRNEAGIELHGVQEARELALATWPTQTVDEAQSERP